MTSAAGAPRKTPPRRPLGGCGSCGYVYNATDGCYHRRLYGCSPNCTCSPLICGLGSLLIQFLRPDSVANAVSVSLPCSSSGSDDEACSRSLIELVRGLMSAAIFWRRVSIGLGVLCSLLIIALVIAIVSR